MNDFVDQFLGFNSATPVTRVVLRYGSGTNVGLFHFMDDLRFAAIPEPASLALFALTSAAAFLFTRRK